MGLVTLQEGIGLESHVRCEFTREFPVLTRLVMSHRGSGGVGSRDTVREVGGQFGVHVDVGPSGLGCVHDGREGGVDGRVTSWGVLFVAVYFQPL